MLDPTRTRRCGHSWDDQRPNRRDCATCHRLRERARADRKRGGPPRKPDPQLFPCGHPRSQARRTKPSTCGTCHREAQKARYEADPATYRAKARAYQKANRDKANARARAFLERNPGYYTIRAYAPDQETREWLTIIAGDPCSYCGGPAGAVDHIKPVSRNGENHWTNFTATCLSCNSSKNNRELLHWLLGRS